MPNASLTIDGTEVIKKENGEVYLNNTNFVPPNPFTFRNKIINGDMQISQRGDFSTDGTHGFTTNAYTVDRWKLNSNGAGTDYIQHVSDNQPDGLYNSKSLKMTVKSTDAKWRRISQSIEDYKQFVEGRVMTISFYYKAQNVSGQLKVGQWINNNSVSTFNKIADLPSTNTWVKKEITFTVHKTAINFTYYPDINFGFASDSGGSAAGVVGDYIEVTGVQLEEGPVATPFEQRPIGLELSLCQRYYQKSYDLSEKPGGSVTYPSSGTHLGTYTGAVYVYSLYNTTYNQRLQTNIPLKTRMRSATGQTIKIYNPYNGDLNNVMQAGGGSSYAITIQAYSETAPTFYATVTGNPYGNSVGDSYRYHWVVENEL